MPFLAAVVVTAANTPSYVFQESQSAFEEVCRAAHAELRAARAAVSSRTAHREALLRRIEAATKAIAELQIKNTDHVNTRPLPPGQPTAAIGMTSCHEHCDRALQEPRRSAGCSLTAHGHAWPRRRHGRHGHSSTARVPSTTYTCSEQSTGNACMREHRAAHASWSRTCHSVCDSSAPRGAAAHPCGCMAHA